MTSQFETNNTNAPYIPTSEEGGFTAQSIIESDFFGAVNYVFNCFGI